VIFLSGLLAFYLGGAVCGTLALRGLAHRALLIPAAVLVVWLLLHIRLTARAAGTRRSNRAATRI
jgi:uncharacterized membrane protein YoaK (UPF0700 family)